VAQARFSNRRSRRTHDSFAHAQKRSQQGPGSAGVPPAPAVCDRRQTLHRQTGHLRLDNVALPAVRICWRREFVRANKPRVRPAFTDRTVKQEAGGVEDRCMTIGVSSETVADRRAENAREAAAAAARRHACVRARSTDREQGRRGEGARLEQRREEHATKRTSSITGASMIAEAIRQTRVPSDTLHHSAVKHLLGRGSKPEHRPRLP
jgi:hypothetical protein